jgi:formylglycine-generating enzyme required for sulfatase activity/predicted Ser/Thr protein kinase
MSVDLSGEDVLRDCRRWGLVGSDILQAFTPESWSGEAGARALADEMVQCGGLTRYQADEILAGRASRLRVKDIVIVSKIGDGGMGDVYRGRHVGDGRELAIKQIAIRLDHAEDFRRRFEREFRVLETLEHDNVVRAHSFGEAHGLLWFAMELVAGTDLAKYLKTIGGRMGMREAVDCILQAARGLAHAHEKNIVHRDIKPSNLMRRPNGRIVVLDLGLAKFTSESAADFTSTGRNLGTPDYMAPEQAVDAKSVDHRADIYSLGATLWACLAGKVMFPRDNPWAAIHAHQTETRPELTEAAPSAPRELSKLFRQMVARDVELRPKTTQEVVVALERVYEEIVGERMSVRVAGVIRVGETEAPSDVPATLARVAPGRPAGERRVVVVNGIEVPFRWCPRGTFLMGSPEGETRRRIDEDQVKVTLTRGFWMGETAVTQKLYKHVTGKNPSHFRGRRVPVERVSWYDAVEFCVMLTEWERSVGRLGPTDEYRLPTEAEWEYACRAGTTTAYWFGDEAAELDEYGWYKGNSEGCTHDVGLMPGNACGLCDMHGNVWEWCGDLYSEELPGGCDPMVRSKGSSRVYRGGSWNNSAGYCRSAYRGDLDPSSRSFFLGFRLALSPSGESPEEQVE